MNIKPLVLFVFFEFVDKPAIKRWLDLCQVEAFLSMIVVFWQNLMSGRGEGRAGMTGNSAGMNKNEGGFV